jgi:LysM repeat protein
MNTKSIIVFGLTTAILTSALVFDGVAHRHTANSNQAISQTPVTNAAALPNTSNPGTEVQPNEDQSAAAAADSAIATDHPGQDTAPDDGGQLQTDTDADTSQPAAPQPIVIPAGTTLTVRLGEALGSRTSEVGQRFSATLDRDVVVGGQAVIAAGARVTGKVVSARPAGALAGEANLQLKLTSVNVDNGNLGLATSVRSFGPKIKGKNKVGKFIKGLVKRASGEEREVLLAEQSTYSFTLQRRLQIQ